MTDTSATLNVASDLFTQAIAHHQAGRLDEAVASYRKALLIKPYFAEAHSNLGVALKNQGKLDEAVASFYKSLSITPEDADAHYNLGNALQAQGKLDEAVASFARALTCKPDFTEAYSNLGNALQAQGKLDEAVVYFERALTCKPDDAEAHFNLGTALLDQGKLDEAVVFFGQALALKPDYAEAHFNLGNALQSQGKLDEAIVSYQRALTCKPDFAEAYSNLGAALQAQGKLEEAVTSCQRALTCKPDFAEAYSNLGAALQAQGKLGEAIVSYERALFLEPDFIYALNGLNNTLCAAKRYDDALIIGRKALLFKDKVSRGHSGSTSRTAKNNIRYGTISASPPLIPTAPEHGKPWIISFSLWGKNPTYTKGAVENVLLSQKIFPDWRCRFYCDETVPVDIIDTLSNNGAEVIMMSSAWGYKRFAWRFLVSDDKNVGRYLCRDCDSRPSMREAAAVIEWITSGKPFHIIRDHPQHIDLILAGLWGGVAGWLPEMATAISQYSGFKNRFSDQFFLGDVIWPLIRDHVLIHDSYYDIFNNRRFPGEQMSEEPHVGTCFKIV